MQIPDAIFYIYAYVKRRFYRLRHENQTMQSKIDLEQIPTGTTLLGNNFVETRKDGKLEANISSDKENTFQTRFYTEETSNIDIADEHETRK